MIHLEKEIMYHIRGEKFSNGLKVKIEEKFEEKKRTDFIRELCIGKNVLHLGCVDHLPLIEEKISNNIWMHKIISDAANNVIGIDINKEGIEFVKQKLGYNNLICADILNDSIPEITDRKWDYMILGEIIEHIDNPVLFLQELKVKYKNIVDNLLLTTPNILNKNRCRSLLKKNMEVINSDHRYWFTPYTLSKILHLAGYKEIQIGFADRCKLNYVELSIRKIKKIFKNKLCYPFFYFNSIIVSTKI